ncbi:unnamed protein product, partial [Choristocarpus tenellus]
MIAIAIDVVQEFELMQVTFSELFVVEDDLKQKAEDDALALSTMEERLQELEMGLQGATDNAERAYAEAELLREEVSAEKELLAGAEALTDQLQARAKQAESMVEDLKAKVRASKDESQRLHGQLEATGLSDTAMMGLLRSRDAALTAAVSRTSALEHAMDELQERHSAAQDKATELNFKVENLLGQLEGNGTFDRHTRDMLQHAEEELKHLRIKVSEASIEESSLRNRLNASLSEIETWARKLEEVERALTGKDDQLLEAKKQATEAVAQISELGLERDELIRRVAEAQEEVSAGAEGMSLLQTELRAREDHLAKTIHKLDESNAIAREKSALEATLRASSVKEAKRYRDLEDQLENSLGRVQSLEVAEASQRHLVEELQHSIDTLEGEMETLQVQIESESAGRKDAESCLTESKEREEEGVKELREMKEQLLSAVERAQISEDEARVCAKRANEVSAERVARDNEIVELSLKLTKAQGDAQSHAESSAELQRRVNELEGEMSTLWGQVDAAGSKLEEEQSRAKLTVKSMEKSIEEGRLVGQQLADVQAELNQALELLGNSQTELDNVRDELLVVREQLRRAPRNEDLASAITAAEEGQAGQAEALEALEQTETTVKRLQGEEAKARGEVNELRLALESEEAATEALRSELEQQHIELRAMEVKATEAGEERDRALERVKDLILKLQTSEGEACHLQDLEKSLRLKGEALLTRLSSVEDDIATRSASLNEAQAHIANLTDELSLATKKEANSQEELKAGREARSSLRRELAEIREEMEASASASTANAAQQEHEAAVLRERADKAEESRQRLATAKEMEVAQALSDARELQNVLELATKQNDALVTELEGSKVELCQVRDRATAVDQELVRCRAELEHALDEAAKAEAAAEEAEAQATAEILTVRSSLAAQVEAAEQEALSLHERVQELERLGAHDKTELRTVRSSLSAEVKVAERGVQ